MSKRFSYYSTTFTPLLLGGVVLWLDPTDLTTITKDGSNFVSAWNDKSGNGYNVAQATASRQPQWTANAFGTSAGILFDGNGDCLVNTSSLIINNFSTSDLYIVLRNTDITQNSFAFVFATSALRKIAARIDNSFYFLYNDATSNTAWNRYAISGNISRLMLHRYNGGETVNNDRIRCYNNNTELSISSFGPGTKPASISNATAGFLVGNRANGNIVAMTGYIAEIVLFNKNLTTNENAMMVNYLNGKYAVY